MLSGRGRSSPRVPRRSDRRHGSKAGKRLPELRMPQRQNERAEVPVHIHAIGAPMETLRSTVGT
jgi:hypothetical protein